ncbi:MAG TPA: RcpC/CpaB family pilus assembly protein, partial [Terriglobales bacterium]|nr:RcpC/CpaB family pilus assembly protein [Terriglobales bacterium]
AGQKLERNSAGEPQMAPVITLLVSPDDAQRLTLASTEGHIQLALRNVLDTKQEEIAATRAGSLYRTAAVATPAPRQKVRKALAVATTPPPPSVYTIEMIRGNKRDEEKF